ncbi:hypothetical protein E4K67_25595 [Desulfosporosinus fructosivorans]|uniref:SCP domain-containing protein n=1 Tax=Desulfosporosinus fructosivorans TaxID=2018669 RepID=A0A4Z0QY74_9FIRM|nr:CAP domain-containing protein [Desulfosporosinus fructosivorans]TGE35370.1 hypothetical protein E4K67_25595 [Desulfosporosinus fructosivorans]
MQKKSKILVGIQIGILMTAVALPVQAAVNIGAPRPLSGSVVTIKSNVAVQATPAPATYTTPTQTTQTTTSVQTSTPSIWTAQPTVSGNVVSLKNIYTQPSATPGTATPTPVTVPAPTPVTVPTTPSTTPIAPVIPPVSALTADEQLMVDMINQQRQAAGVNPVIADLRLTAVGRAKANDMKVNNYFSHTSPTYGSPWAMMQQAGITVGWAGENISGNKSVAGSMAALMQSPGHKANILDPRFTHVGVGIAYGSAYGNLYVQEFLQQ